MIASDAALDEWLKTRSAQTRERLVMEYSYLCARGARKFARAGLERADLCQIAAIGLLKACDRYEPQMKTPFEAYAWLFIVGELMHFVRDQERIVRAPRSLRSLDRRVHHAAEAFTAEHGREASHAELAALLRIDTAALSQAFLYRNRGTVHSLDAVTPRDTPAADAYEDVESAMLLERVVEPLTSLERRIVLALYVNGYTIGEIAARLGYSRRHVSRLHRAALQKIQPVLAEFL